MRINKGKVLWLILFLVCNLALFSCQKTPEVKQQYSEEQDTLTQVSTIEAILNGSYDGEISYKEIKKYGDFGIGTFNALDGEMVAFDGNFYQVKADGKVYTVPDKAKTPFAVVTFFEPDLKLKLKRKIDLEKLKTLIDKELPTRNIFYAIRVDGTFDYIKTRSVPRQKKPYPPLEEVTKDQLVFEFKNIKGTLVGFYCPSFAKGINVAGYHFHFLTEDKSGGGHVLEFKLKKGVLSLDDTSKLYLILP
jgi:acetolactate decarboxylase